MKNGKKGDRKQIYNPGERRARISDLRKGPEAGRNYCLRYSNRGVNEELPYRRGRK